MIVLFYSPVQMYVGLFLSLGDNLMFVPNMQLLKTSHVLSAW